MIRLKQGEPIGETPLAPRPGDRITSVDDADPGTWLDDDQGCALYAHTLIRAHDNAATLLICEAADCDDEPDPPRFR